MKKFLFVLLISCLLCSCTKNDTQIIQNEQEQSKKIVKFSIVENENHPQALLVKTFKKEIEKLSNGTIEVWPYFNSSLYTQEGAMDAIRSDTLEMTTTSMQMTAEYMPSLDMFTSTYFFKNYEHMRKVMDGEIGQRIFDDMSKSDARYVPLGTFYNGSRQLDLRIENEVNEPKDLKGVILRMPSSEAWLNAGNSLGAKATPLAFNEIYTALQNGTIDAQDNPLPAVKSNKFYEVTKQICLTYHIIDAEMAVLNINFWNKLSDAEKEMFENAMAIAVKTCDEAIINQEKELVSFLEKEGLKIVNPNINSFSEYAFNYYYDNGLTKNWDMNLYNQVQELAE